MIDEKYLELFLDEANEHIDDLNRSLLELEQDFHNPEIINEIFRVAHTLKSSAGFVGLEYLSRLAHRMEDLFQLIRDQKIQVNTELVNLLFSCLDAIKQTVANIQSNVEEDKDTLMKLVEQINIFIGQEKVENTENIPEKTDNKKEKSLEKESIEEERFFISLDEEQKQQLIQKLTIHDKVYGGYVRLDEEAPMKNLRLLLIYNRLFKIAKIFIIKPELEILDKDSSVNSIQFVVYGDISQEDIVKICQIDLVEEIHVKEYPFRSEVQSTEIQTRKETKPDHKTIKIEKDIKDSVIKTRNIKVASEKIDYILNNVGELVITNSGLQKIYEDLLEEFGDSQLLSDLKSKIDQAIRIARELQSGVMKMRMMPVGIVFQRFYRPVRDLSLSLGKKVELKIEGEETELDKNIIDSLNDPLMHLIRNAVDHGIEQPEERIEKGKPEIGTIILKAYQSGNHIFIEIQDDGKGLDKEKILKKAVSSGIIDAQAQLSDQEIYEFIFHPGFSTAEQVSNVSGRGVGMNVVKEVAESFKGSVQIHTVPEKGTSFILMFPLTLAIISTIHVKVENEEYAFPLSDVVETIRIAPSQITTLQGKSIINLRKEIVPIYELAVLMGLPSRLSEEIEGETSESHPIEDNQIENKNDSEENYEKEFPVVVTSVGNRKVGYIVDEMIGKKEIVIKSLEQNYKQIPGLIGACLLGDGSIVMVLDVNSLLELATRTHKEQIEFSEEHYKILNAIRSYNQKVFELTFVAKKGKKRIRKLSHQKQEEKTTQENDTLQEESREEKSEPVQVTVVESNSNVIPDIKEDSNVSDVSDAIDTVQTVSILENPETYVLEDFKKDKERRKAIGLEIFKDEQHIENQTNSESSVISQVETKKDWENFLTEKDYERLYSIINSGMVNAGLVLSQLLGVTIDVTVPEFKTILYEEISQFLEDTIYYVIFLETQGEFESLLTLAFDEPTALYTAGELMGIPEDHRNKDQMGEEDIKSVLNELTNIVGSSLLNEIANRTGMSIKPSVPEFHIISVKEFIHLVEQKKHPIADEKIIYINTDFLREETELLGRLFLLPSKPNLIQLLERLRDS